MKFRQCFIGDFVDSGQADIQTGPFGTQLRASDYVPEGTPVINVRNIGFADLRAEKLEFVDEQTAERLAVHLLERNDIVFGRKGAVDRHLFVTDEQVGWMQGSDCIRLRFASEEVCERFVSYWFLRDHHQQWMLTQAGNKATMASLNQDIIKRIPVNLPSRETQTRIVEILSTYDELIENNRRRMTLLEESARLLYQEWFVQLRFPGHEHVRITNGVPEGWARITLGDVCQIRRGASPRPIQAFMGGTVPWFKIGDATSSSSMYVFRTAEHVTEEGAKKSVLLGPGELIISNSATCGLPYFTGVTGCIHDGWLLLQPSSFASRELLYLCLKAKREELVSSVGDGSTQKNLNTEAASRLTLVFPTSDLVTKEFDTAVQPIFKQIHVLARCNDRARAARDQLLPRLMSGEVVI